MSLLTNKKLYLNIGVALALFFVIVLVILLSLKSYTRHGESIPLPDFQGLSFEEFKQFIKENQLNYTITDSVYDDTSPKGTIVRQDPYPHSGVKRGRCIYVTVVSSLPESTIMPDVMNLSVREAVSRIYGSNLTISKINFVKGFDRNAIQKQLIDDQEVEPGTKLKKFAAVTLVASKGERSEPHKVPNLKGLTKTEAMQRLYQNSFNVGNIVGDDEKSVGLVVVSQTPAASDKSDYPLGHKVSFRLSGGKKSSDEELDSLIWTSIMLDRNIDEEHSDEDDLEDENNNEEIF